MAAREYRIAGTVQGVGFRWRAKQVADAMGLSGWVRNNPDGSVGLALAGRQSELDEYKERLSRALGRYIAEWREVEPPSAVTESGFEIVR